MIAMSEPKNRINMRSTAIFRMSKLYSDMGEIVAEAAEYKRRTLTLAHLIADSVLLRERADKLRHCADWMQVDIRQAEDGSLTDHLHGSYCRDRICPQCQRRRALRVYGEVRRMLDAVPGFRFAHMVLTCRNVGAAELPETVSKLLTASRRLLMLPECKRAYRGALRALEVTYNAERDNYHPHLHIMLAVMPSYFTSRDYLPQARLVELWQRCFGPGAGEHSVWIKRATDTAAAVAEVCKYAVKPLDLLGLPPAAARQALEDISCALKGRRLIQTFGVLRDAARATKADLDGDEQPAAGRVVRSYCYRFSGDDYDMFVMDDGVL